MSAPLWTSDEIAAAVGAAYRGPAFEASGVTFDSRTVEPGDLFVALRGERDGHDFIDAALGRGAAGVLAARPGPGPRVVVADTLKGLEALAVAARERSDALRAAVTGSVGKTSLTQAIRLGLDLAGPAHGSVKSYNNHIGVPLTLARMPRGTARAVFEIGMNHAGEIGPLSRLVRPHAATISTIGPVHIENFPDGEAGVAKAKAEVFEGLVPGGTAVLNADNVWFDAVRTAAAAAGADLKTFGSAAGCDARLIDFTPADGGGAAVSAEVEGRRLGFRLRQNGRHWGLNSLAVLLTLKALKVDLDAGVAALEAFEPLEGRGAEQAVEGPRGAFVLIDESYNANPISMAAALTTLGARPARGRRIAAMTDMLELGPQGPALHAALARQVEAAGIDLVFCAGPLMRSLWEALPPTRRGGYADAAAHLAPQAAEAAQAGDVIMVKGSNGSRASAVAAALRALDQRRGGG